MLEATSLHACASPYQEAELGLFCCQVFVWEREQLENEACPD